MSYESSSTLIALPGYGSQGGILDDISSAAGAGVNLLENQGAANAYKQQLAAQQAQMSWVAPVIIGGVVIAGLLLIKKKKAASAAPKSNPARRRRCR